MPHLHGEHEAGQPVVVPNIDADPGLAEQEADHLGVAGARGVHQGHAAQAVPGVDIQPLVQESPHRGQVTLVRGAPDTQACSLLCWRSIT